jgi:hypothetical protein
MRMPFSSASKNALDGGAYCCSKCCCSKSKSETRDRDLTRMRTVRPVAGPVASRQRRWLGISALSDLGACGTARCKLLGRASLTSIRPTFAMHGLTESVNYRAGRRCVSLSKNLYTVFASSFAILNTVPYEHRLRRGLCDEKTTTSHGAFILGMAVLSISALVLAQATHVKLGNTGNLSMMAKVS